MTARALLVLLFACTTAAAGQEPVDTAVVARIRREGLEHSQVLAFARTLSDVYGPRLSGTAQYRRAAEWVRGELTRLGFANAALESFRRPGPSWELEGFSVELTAPSYLRLVAYPKAWSKATPGVVSGTPVLVSVRADSDFARYHGTLRGKIVLNGAAAAPDTAQRLETPAHRYSDGQLDSLAKIPAATSDPFWQEYDSFFAALQRGRRVAQYFADEGVAAILEPSHNAAALVAQGYWPRPERADSNPPAFIVARAHYDRLVHLLEAGAAPRLALRLDARITPDTLGYNVVAELPGTDPRLAAQVVMMGGHLDSWQVGTGATDNAAGCAVAVEALRILKAIGARPKRTIRVALWDGEEASDHYEGSEAYVTRHFADLATMRLQPDHARLSAYFNVDNGTGRIRGVYLQGNAAARPLFAAWLAPFADLGATTLTIEGTGSTDHMSFLGAGLPAFQFIQDPVDYESRTHHSEVDVSDYLVEGDLQQAAVVLAAVAYHAATRAELLPRLPLPAPRRP